MNSYGDMVITTPGPVPEAYGILFRQCMETWKELGSPPILSIWFKDWGMDMGCWMSPEFEGSGHGDGPHHHYAWKFTLDN